MQSSFLDPLSSRNLTSRENEVLQLVAQGLSNKEISSRLNISLKTTENHRHNLMRKLDAHNSADLTREAFRRGLVQADQLPQPD
jgi:two-component system secretion response regulator SsrB